MTLMVVAAALGPALFLVPQRPSAAAVTSYLLVVSGLLSVAAGGLGLMSWRMTAHALDGWLGSAFVVLGVLILMGTGLSGFGAGPIPLIAPADALFNALIAALLVWRGIRNEELGSGISPLAALGRGGGVVLAAAALCIGLQAGGAIPAWASTQAVRSLLYCLSGVVLVSLTLVERRLRPYLVSTALATGLLGVGLLIRSGASSDWSLALASSVPVFLGMSLAFGAALAHLDAVLHSGSQLYRCLQDELDSNRRKTESDRRALEAWLHDLQNAIVALEAAGAVLRSAPDRTSAARGHFGASGST